MMNVGILATECPYFNIRAFLTGMPLNFRKGDAEHGRYCFKACWDKKRPAKLSEIIREDDKI